MVADWAYAFPWAARYVRLTKLLMPYVSPARLRELLFNGYTLVLVAALLVLPVAGGGTSDAFLENRPIEILQFVHVACATVLAGSAVMISKSRGKLESRIFFLFFLLFAWFTDLEVDGMWGGSFLSPPILSNRVILAVMFVTALVSRLPQILILLPWQFDASYFRYFAIGLTGYIGAQLFDGFGNFFGMSHVAKQITEESLELYFGAYFLFSAIEMLMLQKRRKPHEVGIRGHVVPLRLLGKRSSQENPPKAA